MYYLTEDDIIEINKTCPQEWQENEQGVFKQPSGIPTTVKGNVIYMRYLTGGMMGGGYHSDSYLHSFVADGRPNFVALDIVLKKISPEITYLQYKDIERLINETEDDDSADYYGNCSDFGVEYIILDELYNYLKSNLS